MQTRTRLNIALIGGLLVIALLFWMSARDQAGDRPMVDMAPEDIRQLEVFDERGTRWSLMREEDRWHLLSEELSAPAHPERVAQMLQLLRAPVRGRYALDEVDPARFGLDVPVLSLRINDMSLHLGDSEPVQRRRYVKAGDEILLVDDIVYYQFDRPGTALVDNRLLADDSPVEAIEFGRLRLARGEGGHWRLDPPSEMLAHLGEEDLARMARNWQEALAHQTLAWPAPGLGAPLIRVHLANGQTHLFHLVEDDAGAFTLASPATGLRYRFPANQRPALMPAPESWLAHDDDA